MKFLKSKGGKKLPCLRQEPPLSPGSPSPVPCSAPCLRHVLRSSTVPRPRGLQLPLPRRTRGLRSVHTWEGCSRRRVASTAQQTPTKSNGTS